MERIRAWLAALLDAAAVLLPVSCAGCGALDRALCTRCSSALAGAIAPRRAAVRILRADRSALPVFAATAYAGTVRSLLDALKERGRSDAAVPLAGCLRVGLAVFREWWQEEHEESAELLVVVIPSSAASLRRRGYSPLALLWTRAVPGVRPVKGLAAARRVDDQAGLGVEARGENLSGAYAASAKLLGRRVLLVDDVVTSGATLREATRAIEEVGGAVVAAVVIAETAREHSRNSPRIP